jgi:hypothetical protein
MERPGTLNRLPAVLAALLALLWLIQFTLFTQDRDGFTWMDPYQYYGFARGVLEGGRAWNSFEVASIFPYLLMPFLAVGGGSVPAALATQAALTAGILATFIWAGRAFTRPGVWPLAWALWLGCPLAYGLAYEPYSETALTLAVAATLTALWSAWQRPGWLRAALAGGLLCLTLLLKITALVFLAGPLAVLGVVTLKKRQVRAQLPLAAGLVIGAALAATIQLTLFSANWDYWRSLGNTSIPVMELIGPGRFPQGNSALYYIEVLGRFSLPVSPLSLAGYVLAVITLAIMERCYKPRPGEDVPAPGSLTALAYGLAWIGLPLLAFTLQPVKEPRHILPILPVLIFLLSASVHCIGPMWSASMPRLGKFFRLYPSLFTLGMILLTAYSLWQVFPRGRFGEESIPYFTRGASGALQAARAITDELAPVLIGSAAGSGAVPGRETWVRYNLDVAVTGLTDDEALAMAWALRPAILYNLDHELPRPADHTVNPLPLQRYEDLYIYSAFNLYNRRCGLPLAYDWFRPTHPDARPDFKPRVLIRSAATQPSAFRYEQKPARSVEIERPGNPRGGLILEFFDWPSEMPNARQVYAWNFLEANPALPAPEKRTILADLRRAYVLRQDWAGLRVAAAMHPELASRTLLPARNLYWYGFYPGLETIEHFLWTNSPFMPPARGTDAAP